MPAGNARRGSTPSPRRSRKKEDPELKPSYTPEVHQAVIKEKLELMFDRVRTLQHELQSGELTPLQTSAVLEEGVMLQKRLKEMQVLRDTRAHEAAVRLQEAKEDALTPAEEVRELLRELPERVERSHHKYTRRKVRDVVDEQATEEEGARARGDSGRLQEGGVTVGSGARGGEGGRGGGRAGG